MQPKLKALFLLILGTFVIPGERAACQTASPTATTTSLPSATETPTSSPTPGVFPFNPDLNGDGRIDAQDLLAYIRTWRLVSTVHPTPTPPFTTVTGIVKSASTGFGVAQAWVIAGTAATLSQQFGFYQIGVVRTDTGLLLVHKDGFEEAEFSLEVEFPVTLLSPVIFPLGFPTFTPSPSPSTSMTPTPTRTQSSGATSSPTPTPSVTQTSAQPTASRTSTASPTRTSTPTQTRTRTPTATATTVPILGVWNGNLNGDSFVNTDITLTILDSRNAYAQVLDFEFSGPYTFTPPGSIYFQVTRDADAIELDLTWNGGNAMTGTFDLSLFSAAPFLWDIGTVVFTRMP